MLGIEPQYLTKSQLIQRFDGRATQLVIHVMYLKLAIKNHTNSLIPLLPTKLGHYFMIFSHLWMKNHRILLDIINDSIIFLLRYYTHPKKPSFLILTILTINTKIILMAI